MKKLVSVLAAVLMVVVVSAPAFAWQPTKGITPPIVRKSEPKGTERSEIRQQANVQTAPAFNPMRIKGLDFHR